MFMSSYTVTRVSKSLVTPSEPTPNETLNLSIIDRVPGLRHCVRSIHAFKHGQEPAKVIKEALSKTLVHYYPFAGRFIDPVSPASGEVTVACSGEGAYFIKAKADCTLEDVKHLDLPLMIPAHDLLPEPHPEISPLNMPLMMQVTEFKCGGFTVGIISVHTLADGLGAAQFITALSELARGLPNPTIKPNNNRSIIPNPPKPPPGPPPSFKNLNLNYSTFDVTPDSISKIKTHYLNKTGNYCSTFDVSIAKVWQARTRAIKLEDTELVHLCFFANTRPYLNQHEQAPPGFYANCFYPVTVSSTSGEVAKLDLVDLVHLIKEAKLRLPNEFAKWASGGFKHDPYELTFDYNWLFVSDWTKLGFQEVDYGWGTPVHVVPFAYNDIMAVAILGSPVVPKKGSRMMTQCVNDDHLADFEAQMANF
ncbi:LOW QUALITY PROTEIN: acyl transferase 5-like [Dioscorea cayenensis subsp. rotundata]|uniref:LOW QUALITY PROTEIN: acyl transferase 5-like n=1 Tax=Dioscorea cayennensis subsp. rotundata TaxID=55577 RepID=A0AB40BLS2_DIOCR|nr:LOW QUALITY PROTEIN: acyl transferase 5-like [Dioscorea cayenensis subsp. rotundata]